MKKNFKKFLSVFLVVVMLVGIAPLSGFIAPVEASASSATYNKEYYYTNGTSFLSTDMALALPNTNWIGTVQSGSAEKKLTNNGYNLCSQDLNESAGGEYLYFGWKTTTDPANAIRALGVYNGSNPPASYNANVNGGTYTFYPVNKYFPKKSDTLTTGYCDLNTGAGGDYIYLYYCTDPNYGPPLTDFDWERDSSTNDSGNICQTSVNWINTTETPADLNSGAGGKDVHFFTHSRVDTQVNTSSLHSAITTADNLLANSSNYVSVSNLQSAVNTGKSIVNDYNADGLSCNYDQTAINNATNAINTAINALQTNIYFDGNGGTVSVPSTTIEIGANSTWTFDGDYSGFNATRTGYTFKGWSTSNTTSPSDTANYFPANGSSISGGFNTRFYAVWEANTYTVVFDNLINVSKWDTSTAGSGVISNVGNGGFTLTSDNGAGEATSTSPYFPVTAGEKYVVDIDIEGNNWDVYIFFYDADTQSGLGIDFADGPDRRFSSSGVGNFDENGNAVFTAPAGAVKAVIRVDANGSNNAVTFKNIKAYKQGTVADGTSYVAPVTVTYGSTYGTLPTPAKTDYRFVGWFNAAGTQVKDTDTVNITDTLYVTSKWEPIGYTVVWKNWDGTVLETDEKVNPGTTPSYNGETPKKSADAQYTYTFSGWSPAVSPATGNVEYIAQFDKTVNEYTITWVIDGKTETATYKYGDTPVHADPVKGGNAQYSYAFTGWEPAIATVTGNATYKAQFNSTVNTYTIVWKNWDGTVLETDENVPYSLEKLPEYNGDTPVKTDSTGKYTYTFAGWSPTVAGVTGDAEYIAQFTETVNTFTVTWKNFDGSTLETDKNVAYGTDPTYDSAEPYRAPTEQYAYSFSGWTPAVEKVTKDATYTAQFEESPRLYTVTWKNYDGTVLETDTDVAYGTEHSFGGTTPVKPATVQYSYTFDGWKAETVVNENTAKVTYTAQFKETVNEYTIKFVDEDGTELQSGKVPYGTTPVYTGETPVKAATAQYTYTFEGWSPEIKAVDGDATYTAKYSSEVNKYTVTWKNSAGAVLETDENVPYGTMPEFNGETPEKTGDAQFTYTFAGWNPEISEVAGNITYTAQFTQSVNEYTVEFVNHDGTVLQTGKLPYGTTPVYTGETPVKTGDAQYSYTFLGWDPEIAAVTKDVTYTAQFEESTNVYTVTWKNYDGSVLDTNNVVYGTTPEYKGDTPVKTDSTGKYTYTFAGWEPEVSDVTGDVTYTAKFTETINKYTIKFVNEDGTVLQSEELEYDTMPVYKGENPTKAATAQYSYTWTGWDSEIVTVTSDATYTATYTSSINKYTVTWKNEDGTTLETDSNVTYGTTPEYNGAQPTKAQDAQYTYKFKGWTPEIIAVEGNATYTAEFEAVTRSYTIKFVDEDNNVLQETEVAYGETPVYNGETPVKASTVQYTYEFSGWTPAIAEVTGEATYKVVFKETVNKYTIKFVNEDGTVLQETEVAYGETPAYTGETPVKVADEQYTYTFDKWSPAIKVVEGKATYTATYSTTVNTYTVTWFSNGVAVETDENVPYGATPEFNGETPEKAADAKFTYAFAGWTPAISTVTGNVSYTAKFTETLRKYTVTWKNGDNVLETDTGVEYGTEPEYNGAQPTKASTAQYSFTFAGWDPVVSKVTGDVTYTAKFTENLRKYTVTWKNYDGEVLATDTVAYGTTPAYTGETPVKASTPEYTYTWTNAWNKEVVAVTGDAEYTATFTETLRSYKVTWIVDGKEWDTADVRVGDPIPEKTVPAKEGFKGAWDSVSATMPTYDVTITAVYINNGITVTWVIDDDTTHTTVVEAGKIIAPDEAWKTKESTVDTVYTFAGWYEDAEFTKVAVFPEVKVGDADRTYYAKFDTSVREYTIKFVDEDGTELQSGKVAYGETPAYTGTQPTKAATAQYTYTFSGWTPAVEAVSGDAVYTATYKATVNKYKVTFVNEYGTELQSTEVAYGETPVYAGETPTKAATAQYTYTFSGWTPAIAEVTGEATYTAQFTSTVNEYTITFVNEGGAVLQSGKVAYGETPAYTGETPTKAATAQYTYTFSGWTPAIAEVTGEATYTAIYDSTVNEYTVIWTDEDGTVLETDENVPYGKTPSFDGKEPTKEKTAQYTYTFAGWDPAVSDVEGNVTYKATYTSTVNTYTVVWKNEDGIVLETDENVAYGTMPTYDGETPTKAATDEFTYTFAESWTPAVKAVEGDAEYTAVFNATKNSYTVKFVKADGEEISYTLEYGESFTTPANSTKDADATYHYSYAWTPAVNTTVTGNATYTEVLTETEHSWSEWTTILAPTCTATGTQQRECACHYVETKTLSMVPHTEGEAVIENNVEPTCAKEGSYETVVYCTVCKGELSRVKTTVGVVPHTEGEAVIENNVAPDCKNEGSYETVVYCTVCGDELSRVKTTVDALGHTAGEEVIENNFAPDCVNDGSYETVVYCSVCGDELSRVKTTVDALGHKAAETVVEKEVAADCKNDGSYDNVVYCSVCGDELSRETVVVPALGHKAADAVVEKEVAADCKNDGSYDSVAYCSVCNEEISRKTIVIPALGHTKGEAVRENEHFGSCLEGGTYDEVFYCTVCGEEISREKITVAVGTHTPGTPVVENRVVASCAVPSSYDEVVYCSVCGEEISRKTITGSTIAHKPEKIVKEYVKEATCTRSGSYDEVVYCGVCYTELSRTTVSTGAKGHTIVVDKAVEATCTQTGKTVGSHCAVCNVVIVAQTIVPARGHDIVVDRGYEPTCTRTGLTDGSHCIICDIVAEEQEVIPALGHLDENADGICDIDGRDVTDMDPDYGIEVGPEGDGGNHNTNECSICGREHINFFSEIICLIYKILRIFGYKVK